MGRRIADYDWAATSLGPIKEWPQSLRTAVEICVTSRFPMVIWWGPERRPIYNDAWRPLVGSKEAWVLGLPGKEAFPEVWDVIGPMFDGVMSTGESTWSEDALLLLERNGFTEECYFTWSYSPIRGDDGGVGGVFTAVTETTDRVLSDGRTRTLRQLASRGLEVRQFDAACAQLAEALTADPHDVPFALLYSIETDAARLAGTAGIHAGGVIAPQRVDIAEGGPWSIGEVVKTGESRLLKGLEGRLSEIPSGPWPVPPHSALTLPVFLPGHVVPDLVLVAALSPRLETHHQRYRDRHR